LWEKICGQKSQKNYSGKLGEIRAKILCTTQKLPAPTHVLSCRQLIVSPTLVDLFRMASVTFDARISADNRASYSSGTVACEAFVDLSTVSPIASVIFLK